MPPQQYESTKIKKRYAFKEELDKMIASQPKSHCHPGGSIKNVHCENKGIKLNGDYLDRLKFVDDGFLVATSPEELQLMMQDLAEASKAVELKMVFNKTK